MAGYEDLEDEDNSTPRRPLSLPFNKFAIFVKKRWAFILLSSGMLSVFILLVSLLFRDSYESTAVILPPKQDQSVSALLSGSVGGLSALSGGGALSGLGLRNSNEVYVSLLESRTLNTELVKQFDLQHYYHKSTMQAAVKALKNHTSVELGKDNLIRITVQTHEPKLSSGIANTSVEYLHNINTSLAVADSVQHRLFYEEQLDHEKILLAKAETDLQETQTRTGVIQPNGQAEMMSRTISSLRGQITVQEAELQSLKTFDAPQNPDYIRLQAQVTSLRGQLAKFENSAKTQTPGDIEVPTAQLPKSALEYQRRYRDVLQHEQVYALLLKQFEAAQIDAAKTAPVIGVIDSAIPAELASGPPRWVIGLSVFSLGLLLNLAWCGASYYIAAQESQTAMRIRPARVVRRAR